MPLTQDALITGVLIIDVPGISPATPPVINADVLGNLTFADALTGPWTLSQLAGFGGPLDLPVFANAAAGTLFYGALLNSGCMGFFTNLGAAGQPGYYDGANWRRHDTNGVIP